MYGLHYFRSNLKAFSRLCQMRIVTPNLTKVIWVYFLNAEKCNYCVDCVILLHTKLITCLVFSSINYKQRTYWMYHFYVGNLIIWQDTSMNLISFIWKHGFSSVDRNRYFKYSMYSFWFGKNLNTNVL